MARRSSVRYWASRGAYCCEHKGKPHTLAKGPDDAPDGPTFRAACKAHAALICGPEAVLTFGELTAKYLEWHAGNWKPSSTRTVRNRLARLKDDFAEKSALSLTGPELEQWCADQRQRKGWGDTTVRMTLRAVSSAFQHALRAGILKVNPLKSLVLPPEISRGTEVVLSLAQEERIFKSARPALRELCVFLRDTGCRPGEATSAEARHFDPSLRAIVLPPIARAGPTHKTGRKTGQPRVIYLRGEALTLVGTLCQRHPTGPLLRSPSRRRSGPHKGHRWGWTEDGIKHGFDRLRRKANVPGLIPYSFRHTFAVRRLREGWTADALAAILGTSPLMIHRHYGHLAQQTDYLRGLVDGIDGEAKR